MEVGKGWRISPNSFLGAIAVAVIAGLIVLAFQRLTEPPRPIPEDLADKPIAQSGPTEKQMHFEGASASRTELSFPYSGQIVNWEAILQYKTRCENDFYATLKSPGGRVVILMDRDQKRCSGVDEVFTGKSGDNILFNGEEAQGNWRFEMFDLDKNNYSGSLLAFSLKLWVNNFGNVQVHRVEMAGLPQDIPYPPTAK